MPLTLMLNIGWIRCPCCKASSQNSRDRSHPSGQAGKRVSGLTFMGLAAAALMASISERSSGEYPSEPLRGRNSTIP